jgi:LysR family transcriptional regulator, mexEF-oprN operon transcriptional activator
MKINLAGINLNLLVILNTLLEEKNTTKTGQILNMSQSTVSKGLKQLRNIFDDELLLRGTHSNIMLLTPKAKALIIPVKNAIEKISNIFDTNEFDPATAEIKYKIGMTDSATLFILPKLMERFNKLSPKSTISVENIYKLDSSEVFDKYNLITVIGALQKSVAGTLSEKLHDIKYVCIADKNHIELKNKKLTLDIFLKYPHIVVNQSKFKDVYYSILKKNINNKPIKCFEIPFLISALHIIKNTNCLCVVSESIAKRFSKKFNFICKPLPFKTLPYTIRMYWKKENDADPSHLWFRKIIKDILEERRKEREKEIIETEKNM